MKRVNHPINQISAQLLALEDATMAQLREKWREVFGEDTNSHNKQYLLKRLRYRIQEVSEGRQGLSVEACERILELSKNSGFRTRVPSRRPSPQPAIQAALSLPSALAPAPNPSGVQAAQNSPPTGPKATQQHPLDARLPVPGARLRRQYQSKMIEVIVLEQGFEFEGRTYKSLSKIALEITGTRWNGFVFFGLKAKDVQ